MKTLALSQSATLGSVVDENPNVGRERKSWLLCRRMVTLKGPDMVTYGIKYSLE